MRIVPALALATLCALVGCGGGSTPPSATHRDGAGGQPMPTGSPVYNILPGASFTVGTGIQVGYYIAANRSGNMSSFRIVWTSSGASHEFWGTAWTAGTFTVFTPGCANSDCPLEANDYFAAPYATQGGGQRFDWDTFVDTASDGFDFQIDSEPVWFDFYVDGEHRPEWVLFPATDNGGALSPVKEIPFGLQAR